MSHAVRTWSAVCLGAPQVQYSEKARQYLGMDKGNRPTPVRRQLSLTQAVRSKANLTGLVLVLGIRARNLNLSSEYSVSPLMFGDWPTRTLNFQGR